MFKVPFEEREVLVEVEPETFFFTPHYKKYLWSSYGPKSSTLTGLGPT